MPALPGALRRREGCAFRLGIRTAGWRVGSADSRVALSVYIFVRADAVSALSDTVSAPAVYVNVYAGAVSARAGVRVNCSDAVAAGTSPEQRVPMPERRLPAPCRRRRAAGKDFYIAAGTGGV